MNEIYTYIILFFIYSFLGYLVEVSYCSIGKGHFVNRGFLHGPFLPIYGIGGVGVLLILKRVSDIHLYGPVYVFIFGMLLASAIEYIGSWGLEKLFSIKLWDYSSHKYNLNGRICLKNSILFGIMTLVVIYLLQPILDKLLSKLSLKAMGVISIILTIYFIIDLIFSVISIISFKRVFEEIKTKLEDARRKLGVAYGFKMQRLSFDELKEKINNYIEKEISERNKLYELRDNLDSSHRKIRDRYSRIIKSNPTATFRNEESKELLEELKRYINRK